MSNRNRTFPDASDFTTPGLANEASSAATRDAVRGDVYGSTMTFQAIVLTQPVPMDSSQIFNFYGKDHTQGADAVPTFQFKGRIVTGDLPSPHEFIPDPCKLDSSVNFQTTLDLVSQHTTFISEAGYDGPPPTTGDLVEVELEAGDVKFDLQYGTFKNIVNSAVLEPGNYESSACSNLPALFSSFGGTVTAGSVSSNIFEGRPRGGTVSSQMVKIEGANITNTENHKALPGVVAWIEDIVTVMNGIRAAGSAAVNSVPHSSTASRVVPGCTAGSPRTGVEGTTAWKVKINSGFRSPASQARAMMGLRARTFGSFCLRYTLGGTEYELGDVGEDATCTTTVAMGTGKSNFSDLGAQAVGKRITWPTLTSRALSNCSGTSSRNRKKCSELVRWAITSHATGFRGTVADGKYRGLADPPWGRVVGNIIYPNPVIYHIYLLYGSNQMIEDFLKLDYNANGGDEATSYIEERMLDGVTFSAHMNGMALDISVGAPPFSVSQNMDFFIDICYNAGQAVLSPPSGVSYEYAITAAAQRLRDLGKPRAGSCFYHDGHLHIAAPTQAKNRT